ncbi:MAG: ABC transporter ATP-binding protein [Planctomycetota bacterium]|nr:ABC transporter ATP-binding protein [Planctomycetota bacterium]
MNSPDTARADLVIQVTDLRKTYRDGLFRKRKIEALKGVSLEVGSGQIFGLLGPNGAGKTTLIKVLLGIVHKTSGEAMLLGQPAGHKSGRRRVGYLPEGHRIPRHLTGNTALEYYGSLSGLSVAETRRRRGDLLKTVGLSDWGRTNVTKYSKGMLQRLGLAQAMLHEPDVLVLDEPTDGVDPVGRSEIRDVLNTLKSQGKTIFLNSHLLQEIELVCDQVAILFEGEVLKVGPVTELTNLAGDTDTLEATLELEGDAETVTGMVPEHATSCDRIGDNRFRVTIPSAGQEDIDGLIDTVREHGLSIISVNREKLTLEEAFLRLVRGAAGGDS